MSTTTCAGRLGGRVLGWLRRVAGSDLRGRRKAPSLLLAPRIAQFNYRFFDGHTGEGVAFSETDGVRTYIVGGPSSLQPPENLASREVGLDLSDQKLRSAEALGQRGPVSSGGLERSEHDAEFLVGEGVEAQVARHQATLRHRYCHGAYFDGVKHEVGTNPYWRAHGPHAWNDREDDGLDCWCGGT